MTITTWIFLYFVSAWLMLESFHSHRREKGEEMDIGDVIIVTLFWWLIIPVGIFLSITRARSS